MSGKGNLKGGPAEGRLLAFAACAAAWMAAVFLIAATTQAGDVKVTAVEQIAPRIRRVSFTSRVLGVEKCFCVVLPAGYTDDSDDWPWLAILHGRGRNERSLVDDARSRDALLTAPFVVVLPDGDNSWYIDSPTGRYEKYLAEVLQLATARFGLSGDPARRAITGWSMGGYGCVRFVQTHGGPDGDWQFALVAPIIGLLDYPSDPRRFPAGQSYPVRTKVFGEEPGSWAKLNPIHRAERLRGMSVMLITADRAFDRTMNERFARRLNELGIAHDLKVLEGTHSLDVVRDALPMVIERTKKVFKTKVPIELELLGVKKIWDRGRHNAFTDMVRFDGRWYVAFREAGIHGVPAIGKPGGKIRIIHSEDGVARGDFTKWTFRNLGLGVGGPTLIELPSGHIVAATRLYDGRTRTSLSWLDPECGKLVELLALPSGGDTSYPGLVWHDNMLWVSYYSSHEGKTSIYLAKVGVRPAGKR